ncbi:MAG: type II toxin-antitoxin system HicB family antitoxin [Methanoculleus sp.]
MELAKMRLTVLIREEEGVYVSRCPELEVASCGDTPEEAFDSIREAIGLYLENAKELGMLQDPDLTPELICITEGEFPGP